VPIVLKSGSLNLLEPSGPVKGCNGIALALPSQGINGNEDVLEKHGWKEWSTSSHDSEKFRTRSMEKRRGMAFGLWETATAVIEPDS
jgi:hypothetical protein